MCLALPMRIIAVDGVLATIATEGLEQRASLMLVPDAKVGDYVLVHAGFAIGVLDEAEAHETLALLREIGSFEAEDGGEVAHRSEPGDGSEVARGSEPAGGGELARGSEPAGGAEAEGSTSAAAAEPDCAEPAAGAEADDAD